MITYDKEIKICKPVNGYYIFCDSKHPLANSYWVYLHRHVASMKEGRWLEPDEHVHHIDGNRLNNDPENLMILNQKDHMELHHPKTTIKKKCVGCKKYTSRRGKGEQDLKYCSHDCWVNFKYKIVWPTPEEMQKIVWENPTSKIAKEIGVSDVAIAKFCKKNNITKPPRGYWRKLVTGNI